MIEKRRITELDALRGIAAFAVLLYHFTFKFNDIFQTGYTSKFEFSYGHYGVQLFFIISGFVIFMTLEKVQNAFEFVYKRFSRLYPTFWICMALTFFTVNAIGPEYLKRGFGDFVFNITMMPDYLGFRSIDGAYWSLVPELFFYLLMVFVFLSKKVKRIEIIGFFWLGLILINYFYKLKGINLILNLYYGCYFLAGINFYKIWKEDSKLINHIQILLSLLVIGIINDAETFIVSTLFFIIFYLFVFEKLRFIAVKPLIYLGEISYALYLIHQFIGYTLQLNLIKVGVLLIGF
ncbi:MAG: acyltransferase, partial [Flavobacteriaceae bacterium]|nr:acyltransferase [Flavobacteriaceae bacterium]